MIDSNKLSKICAILAVIVGFIGLAIQNWHIALFIFSIDVSIFNFIHILKKDRKNICKNFKD